MSIIKDIYVYMYMCIYIYIYFFIYIYIYIPTLQTKETSFNQTACVVDIHVMAMAIIMNPLSYKPVQNQSGCSPYILLSVETTANIDQRTRRDGRKEKQRNILKEKDEKKEEDKRKGPCRAQTRD